MVEGAQSGSAQVAKVYPSKNSIGPENALLFTKETFFEQYSECMRLRIRFGKDKTNAGWLRCRTTTRPSRDPSRFRLGARADYPAGRPASCPAGPA